MRKFGGSTDPSRPDFHPLKAMVKQFEVGNGDETVWLAFLTTHFGQDVRKTVRLFYGKFGKGRWTWDAVREDPAVVRDWMRAKRDRLKKLKFGNHRKRRIMDPVHPRGTWAVIRSFVDWVGKHGNGSPNRALRRSAGETQGPAEAFDRLYQILDILDFGRTAKFDLLCLLGNLRVVDVSPGHCYLKGATGPKQGALLMVAGHKEGSLNPRIESVVQKLTRHLGVPVEAMEDALCNWQKRPKSKKGIAEVGYVTTTCG